jgi:hypothetical protein
VTLQLPFRERRARRVAELTLAAVVALSVIAIPGLLPGQDVHANQAGAVGTTTTHPASTPSTTAASHAPVDLADPTKPVTVADEQAFRQLWSTDPAFRMSVAYAKATPAERAALDAYFNPPPPPPPAPTPAPTPAPAPAAPRVSAPAPVVADGSVWDRIAACESHGNWATNTGNGYSGGLQFSHSTWSAYGGGQFAPQAWQASREQQNVVAERIHASQGSYRAWPVCGRRA